MDPGITHINKMANHSLDFPQFFKALKFKKKQNKTRNTFVWIHPTLKEKMSILKETLSLCTRRGKNKK